MSVQPTRLHDVPPRVGTPGLDEAVPAPPPSKLKNASLGEGTAVANFRDATDGSGLAKGRVFRSGALAPASERDAARILDQLRVRTVVDLRSDKEVASDDAAAPLVARLGGGAGGARVVRVPLLEERKLAPVMFGLMPVGAKARLLCCLPCLGRRGASRLMYEHGLQPLGLLGLYVTMVETSGARLLAALDAVLAALEAEPSGAVLFHCSAGKDRTGVLAMLILSACGVPRAAIVEQYTRSEHWHAELREGLKGMADDFGDSEGMRAMLRAPAATMEALLDHLDAKHGSAQGYLAHIGFSDDKQARMRAALAPAAAGQGRGSKRA